MSVDEREVYPSPAVVLVAFEARHPQSAPLTRAALAQLKADLAGELPLLRPVTKTDVQIGIGPKPQVSQETIPRFQSRDGRTAVTFATEALVVETTRYGQYEDLREVIRLALEARQSVDAIDGIERLGLRYIDEIRVPTNGRLPHAWADWVDPGLLGPAHMGEPLGLVSETWQSAATFSSGPGHTVVIRYGPREGYAVDPAGALKRPIPLPGPFFLLDIDSFWTPTDDVPEFEAAQVLSTCDTLHEPVRCLFESLITERLRKEVLRNVTRD